MINIYSSTHELYDDLSSCYDLDKRSITLLSHLQDAIIDRLAYTSQFGEPEVRTIAQEVIWEVSHTSGAYSASIQKLYDAISNEDVQGFTVPAINLRMLTYDMATTIFSLMQRSAIGPIIFELAISEQEYTYQPPQEFVSSILAAAVKSGYTGPVFIQGDHYQFRSEAYQKDKATEIGRIKRAIELSIKAGMYNIDIDGSTLVDLQKKELMDQQWENFSVTAEMTKYIRSLEPKNTTISVGGEIGHIGGKNSTVDEFEAFMDGYNRMIAQDGCVGLSKVSVQTGTHHGGVVSADGSLEEVAVDFDVLRSISRVARRTYNMGGSVQHGASTLSEDVFHTFPECETLEIHLSTEFQNITYEYMPEEMRERMYEWIKRDLSDEMKPDMTEDQFLYSTRKKAWGPFKERLWQLDPDEKQPILDHIHAKIAYLCSQLHVRNTRHVLLKYYDEKPNA